MKSAFYAAAAAVALVPGAASANEVSGTSNGLNWIARSNIVGQGSTGTVASGGSAFALAPNSAGYSGVVGMLMTYSNGDRFVCSGSLLTSGRILTAAHCVSDGYRNGVNGVANGLVRTQVLFANNAASDADSAIYGLPAGVTAIDVQSYNVNVNYTGEVIDQNDIAVLTLAEAAPVWAQKYEIYNEGDLSGFGFNVTGYGNRSVVGGAEGTTGPGAGAGSGRRRQGDNLYDYRLGDALFDGFFTDRDANGENFFGTADVEFSYVSDFDQFGSADNNQSCFIAQVVSGQAVPQFCTQAVGRFEVGIAGGDSGGAAFIGNRIASVNSYSLSFGTAFGDFKPGLQSSWGEMNGFVPTFIHADFIAGVPEPATWAMLILGMGVVGASLRRRTRLQLRHAF